VTEFGGGIDPFEIDLLEGFSRCVNLEGFSQGEDSLLDTRARSLDHDEVVFDLTVSDEATHWCDPLGGNVKLGGGVGLVRSETHTVNLVVDRSTVMVSILTGTSNSPLHVSRMPGSNTGDLSETLVRLSRQLLGSPSGCDTTVTVTLGYSDNINQLILLKDGWDFNGFLKQSLGKVDLVSDGASVNLDLHDVSLLLLEWRLADLAVGDESDNGAVLLDALKIVGDGSTVVVGVLLGVLGEGLLL